MSRHDVSVFAARRGQSFALKTPDGAASDVELVEVRDLGRRKTEGGELSNYALTFLARSQAVLPQAIYRLEHAELGAMDLFLVPVARGADGVRYEAVFN